MEAFKDNFSQQSHLYVKYRPYYPTELYAYLSSLTDQHALAWDCGTGNGQAAMGLTDFYNQIIATDPSEQQIKNAFPHDKIKYRIEKAENNSIKSSTIDLVTIANALHWLDFEAFYEEVRRALKPNGIIAAWAYGVPTISREIDDVVNHFHYQTLGTYWLPENKLVEEEYTTIPFPFQQIQGPDFSYRKVSTLPDLIGYFNTWSATQRFINKNKFHPTDQLFNELLPIWGAAETERVVCWKLILKVGRN